MRALVLIVVLAGCGRSPEVFALVESAAIRVAPSEPNGLAFVDASVRLIAPHRIERVAFGGGHLTGESWDDYVQYLKLSLVGELDGSAIADGEVVKVVNAQVTNASLTTLCGLQLNFGVTWHDARELVLSDRWPLRIDCAP
jgi:hypothetical protein